MMIISSLSTVLLALSVVSSGASSIQIQEQQLQVRQSWSSVSARDRLCNQVMCIEAEVEGEIARYTLRSTGAQKLGWMALGFGHYMSDSAMVIMWPSGSPDADGSYASVTLSQRKAPYETMPLPDPSPPFVAALELSGTSVTGEEPQMAFTRPAPPDGMQDIIWAFSRTPPESADADAHISIHHKYGIAALNLTRTAVQSDPSNDDAVPVPVPSSEAGEHDDAVDASKPSDASAADESTGVPSGGVGGFANLVHAGLCTAAFLLVIPSGALVVQYARLTNSEAAYDFHRNLQFGVAGASIAGGMLAYLFMDNNGSGSSHKWWGVALLLLYGVQCAVGFRVRRTPALHRTRVQRITLAVLGASIVLLAFYDAWLGFAAAGDGPFLWGILFVVIPSLYFLGVVVIQRRYGSMGEDVKGDYVALDSRAPNYEAEDGEVHKAADAGL